MKCWDDAGYCLHPPLAMIITSLCCAQRQRLADTIHHNSAEQSPVTTPDRVWLARVEAESFTEKSDLI